ncbi:hypothetical protein [Plantactinospora sp. B5E13]|uniref:hypothetical protein n=1 Tax=unclassified Plantactinospora TaxID=2631981 RepID=UPI00325E5C8A
MVMWRAWLGFPFGVLLIMVGATLAHDYRGIATKHVELSERVVRPLSPFRRSDEQRARLRAFSVMFDRLFGVFMMGLGLVSLVVSGYLLFNAPT